jgi:hypothetical protein
MPSFCRKFLTLAEAVRAVEDDDDACSIVCLPPDQPPGSVSDEELLGDENLEDADPAEVVGQLEVECHQDVSDQT